MRTAHNMRLELGQVASRVKPLSMRLGAALIARTPFGCVGRTMPIADA